MNKLIRVATCSMITALLGLSGCIIDREHGARSQSGERADRGDQRGDRDNHDGHGCAGTGHDNADGRGDNDCHDRAH